MQSLLKENIKSVIIIDNNEIDNFINHKLLNFFGIIEVISFVSPNKALAYLEETNIKYQLILVGVYLPIMNGFDFIDQFNELGLNKKHGEILLLSAFYSPLDIKTAERKGVKFINKPLTIEAIADCFFKSKFCATNFNHNQ